MIIAIQTLITVKIHLVSLFMPLISKSNNHPANKKPIYIRQVIVCILRTQPPKNEVSI